MSESNIRQNDSKSNDEIDIFEFCSRLWKTFKNFLTGVRDLTVSVIIFLIRKSLWMVAFALAGMFLGYALYSISRTYYTSSLEGNTGGIDNSAVIDHINKLNLVTSKPSLLANYLGMTVEQASAIRSIKAYYGIDINRDMKPDFVDVKGIYNPKDTMQTRVPSFLAVNISVYDESILPVLRKGLFQYINRNPYIQELFIVDRRQKREMIVSIEREIGKIDSLQRLQRERIRREVKADKGQLVIMGTEPEMRLFYQDLFQLYDRKQNLEKSIEISDEIIVVVQDFTPLQQEERPVLYYIIVGGAVMAVLGLVCALLWQYRKRIWTLIKEDSTKR